ncbi:UNVERIFIED_CONTAM: AT-hook motif nuclear-localized protein 10 [Sesamum latifolium]|uniref:AT-hook motif nuclear-localized protein 10 n=1 Tax=Sesamum latifolium TaxID=2727402 RepID=A0AAW2WFN4_9LAMI
MSGSSEAAAVMASREPFGVTPTAVNSPASAMNPAGSRPQLEQQIHIPYTADGAAAGYSQVGSSPPPPYQSIPAGATVINHVMNLNSVDQKRKRGRPRKYGPDGSMAISMASQQQPISITMPQQQQQTFSQQAAAPSLNLQMEAHSPVGGSASPTVKKARGRPRGSSNKKHQKEALGDMGSEFLLFKGIFFL